MDFGAFVKLEDGVEGLVHISQLADHHVANTQDVVTAGQKVDVKVISIDEQARRIGLSIREAKKTNKPKPEPVQEAQPQEEPESSGVTIGELVGDLGALLQSGSDEE